MNYRKLYIEYLLKNTEDMNTYTYSCYCEKDNIFCYLWKFFLLMAKENKNIKITKVFDYPVYKIKVAND